jgi:hypothetical protein
MCVGGGNVGIGTTNPITFFHLNAPASTNCTIYFGVNGTMNGYFGQTASAGSLSSTAAVGDVILRSQTNLLFTAGGDTERMKISSAGQVGIGNVSSGWTLAVNSTTANNSTTPHQLAIFGNNVAGAIKGYLYIGSSAGLDWLVGKDNSGAGDYRFNISLYTGEQRMTLYTNGNYAFAGSNVSDIRLKSNINTISLNALNKVSQLVPKSYYMTDNPDQIRYGFIAQEVKNILPDLISGTEGEKEYLGLDYNGILALTVKSIQELKAENDTLKEILQRNNIQ